MVAKDGIVDWEVAFEYGLKIDRFSVVRKDKISTSHLSYTRLFVQDPQEYTIGDIVS